MRWPWSRTTAHERLVLSWGNQTLCYALARQTRSGHTLEAIGVEEQGNRSPEEFADYLIGKGLGNRGSTVMLTTDQYSQLQIAAPAVPPEELKAAAKFQIRDMVDTHLDDITIDVIKVGDGQEKAAGQLFVFVGKNSAIKDALALAQSLGNSVDVVDVLELAQRNLQSAFAQSSGHAELATATFMVVGPRMGVLSISAGSELYFSRRLELPAGFASVDWAAKLKADGKTAEPLSAIDAYTPVQEYVPEYVPSYSADAEPLGLGEPAQDLDGAQRLANELQRSLDLWERTWSQLPLADVNVYIGPQSADFASWLQREHGIQTRSLDLETHFPQLKGMTANDALMCAPLLGVLLRTAGQVE